MKIARLITYEGTAEQLQKQMEHSLQDGTFNYRTTITVKTVETDVPNLTGGNPKGWQPKIDKDEQATQNDV